MEFNKAINPKDEGDSYAVSLMPSRAGEVKNVIARPQKDGVGGSMNLATGTASVPTGDNAEERTIRFHEAMHAAHTARKFKPQDLMDQALEDARMHRYCSRSAVSRFTQAREDELDTAGLALEELLKAPALKPGHSVRAFRAYAILKAGSSMHAAHVDLLKRVLARFGKDAETRFSRALIYLASATAGDENWNKARKALQKFFASAFETREPAPVDGGIGIESEKKDKEDEGKFDAKVKPESKPESKEDEDEREEEETSAPESEEDGEGEEEETEEDSPTGEEGEDGESGDEDLEESEEEGDSPAIAPVETPSKPKKSKPAHVDTYTADLTPACDAETYKRMHALHPLELRIKRLDMDINRVKLSMGRKAPLSVVSGRQIQARKLAGAVCNPSMRVFARPVASGGFGTILIDASGSMAIPETTLIDFLAKAPALTLAFYNAPSDSYSCKHGNIFIYAANGYRASMRNLTSAEDYGGGNLIDYQAIAWLIKQPAPHYIVTDRDYTGAWRHAAQTLTDKLLASNDLRVVRSLEAMQVILEVNAKKGK